MKIYEGQRIPYGYGHAWRNYTDRTDTFFLIPFNFLIKWLRESWFWLAKPRDYASQKAYRSGYDKGFEAGKESGLAENLKLLQEAISLASRITMVAFLKGKEENLNP